MVVLGLILLLAVSVVVVSVLIAGDGAATLNLVGADIITTERVLFLAGAVSSLVAVFALWLLVRGTVRARARRSEMNRLRQAAASAAPVGPGDSPSSSSSRSSSSSHGPSPSSSTSHGPSSSTSPAPSPQSGRTLGRDDEGDHFATLPRE
jgi:ABC-type nickel/cobalt efflux system permease component RcnA